MPATLRTVLPLLLASSFFGCSSGEPQVQSQMHQVLGALQIPDRSARNAALATACKACANEGDVESVLLGIPKMDDIALRKNVTESCCEIFRSADKADAADRISRLVAAEP